MTKRKPTPDIKKLQAAYSVDIETGRITANFTTGNRGQFKAGRFVDTTMSHGYRVVFFEGSRWYAQFIVWCIVHGEPPTKTIDHINRVKSDNRPCNLRDVSHAENLWNMPVTKRNKIGIKGLSISQWNSYRVIIRAHRKAHYIGTFKTICAAIKARKDAEAKYHVTGLPQGGEGLVNTA